MFVSTASAAAVLIPVVVAIVVLLFGKPGYRTLIFNAVMGLPALLAELAQTLVGFQWSAFMPPAEAAKMGLVVLILNTIFRFLTKDPVGGTK